MSGTPVITTDWGAFPETVIHGVTGYRCRTMDHFLWAVKNIDTIKPKTCREWAIKNYSMERITGMYEEFFHMCKDVHEGKGFYEIHEDRKDLNWLKKIYPEDVNNEVPRTDLIVDKKSETKNEIEAKAKEFFLTFNMNS